MAVMVRYRHQQLPPRCTLLIIHISLLFVAGAFSLQLRLPSTSAKGHRSWIVFPTSLSDIGARCRSHDTRCIATAMFSSESQWTGSSLPSKQRRRLGRTSGSVRLAGLNGGLDEPEEHDHEANKREPGDLETGTGQGGGAGEERRGGSGREEPEDDHEEELRRGGSSQHPFKMKEKAEFSRMIESNALTSTPKTLRMEATSEECALLAKRFSLGSMQSLRAQVRVVRGTGSESRKLRVKGRVVSKFTQLCCASRTPFSVTVDEEFQSVVQEVSLDSVESTLWSLDKNSEVDDEIMEGQPLDVGEIAAQEVGLLIDPFATHPGVDAEGEKEIVISLSDFDNLAEDSNPGPGEEVEDMDAMRKFFDDAS